MLAGVTGTVEGGAVVQVAEGANCDGALHPATIFRQPGKKPRPKAELRLPDDVCFTPESGHN